MELTITIQEKDYLEYTYSHIRKWRPKSWYALLFSLAFILGIICYSITADGFGGLNRLIGASLIGLTFFYLLVWIILFFKSRAEYRSNDVIKLPIKMMFDQHGIQVETARTKADHPWSAIKNIKQSNLIIAIYISNSMAYIIPKNQLSLEEQNQLKGIFDTLKKGG